LTARVVVVGAGISGLAAAHALGRELPSDVEVLVLEAASTVGGKLRTGQVAGVPYDLGAEAVLNRRPEAVALARAVGLGDDLVHPATITSSIWTRDALRPLPRTVLGVPADSEDLARSGILSLPGLARARTEPELAGRGMDLDSADAVSVGSVIDRRFGPEVTDRLVEPLLGGVYAGHARRLSLAAAAPQIARLATQRSLLRAAAFERAGAEQVPVFAGVRGGIGRLAPAVAASARATIRTGTTVRRLQRGDGGGWLLTIGATTDERALTADAVILATPAPATARLLADVSPAAAGQLRQIEYASMAVVTLAYPRDAVAGRLRGSGFLVPPVDRRAVKAVTFSTNKWEWLDERCADESVTLLRASIGRHGEAQLLQRDDAELVWLAAGELEQAAGLRGPLVDAQVTRWGGGLPQYIVGHQARVARIRTAVAALDGLELCGAAYRGVGIAACVADGQRAATRIVSQRQGQ